MQNTNKEFTTTPCVKITPTDLTELTKELFTWFDSHHIKVNIDYLLLGWLGSSYFEATKNERVQIFDFFNNAGSYFSATEKLCADGKEVTPELFDEIMHSNFEYNGDDAKRYCKNALYFFLEGNISDDNETRNDVMNMIKIVKKYFEDSYTLTCKKVQ